MPTYEYIYVHKCIYVHVHVLKKVYMYQSWARAFFYASRSLAELFALALSRSFLGLKFRVFAFALSCSRAP